MLGFDTADITTGYAHEILKHFTDQGETTGAVGVYMRADRTPDEEIVGLCSVGLHILSLWEKGHPTDASYFTEDQARIDAAAATAYCKFIGQPAGTPIFYCVDCDISPDSCRDYLMVVHQITTEAGYLAGTYGPGEVLMAAIDEGISHYGYLAQSIGWSGYDAYLDKADVVQKMGTQVLGFDVDPFDVRNSAVLWQVAT